MAFKSGLDDIAAILIDRLDAENLIRSSSDCLPVFAALELKEEKLDLVVKMLEKIYSRSQLYLSHTLLYKLNAHKHSILQVAIENNHLNIVEVIIKRFYPDYNKLDSNGNTPTLLAAEAGNIAVLNILVSYKLALYK
jgi:ankyrin repeat protein